MDTLSPSARADNAYVSLGGAYDVSADGKRFVMITCGAPDRAATREVRFV